MALTRWIARKSFNDAMLKAAQLKIAAKAKEQRNSGLFTQAQQNLLKELRLHERDKPLELHQRCQYCNGVQVLSPLRIKPSRSKTWVRVKRR